MEIHLLIYFKHKVYTEFMEAKHRNSENRLKNRIRNVERSMERLMPKINLIDRKMSIQIREESKIIDKIEVIERQNWWRAAQRVRREDNRCSERSLDWCPVV